MNTKLRSLRRIRDFSQDYMASQLNISQRAYSMLENGETKNIDEAKLEIVLKTLGISKQFFDEFEPENTLNQKNMFNDVGYGYVNKISNSNDANAIHKIYEVRIKDLKEELEFLKEEIKFLRDKF